MCVVCIDVRDFVCDGWCAHVRRVCVAPVMIVRGVSTLCPSPVVCGPVGWLSPSVAPSIGVRGVCEVCPSGVCGASLAFIMGSML